MLYEGMAGWAIEWANGKVSVLFVFVCIHVRRWVCLWVCECLPVCVQLCVCVSGVCLIVCVCLIVLRWPAAGECMCVEGCVLVRGRLRHCIEAWADEGTCACVRSWV